MRRRRLPVSVTVHPLARINTRRWNKLVAEVVREERVCWLKLPGCTVWSQTADHVIPRKHRPDLTYERRNLRGACQYCNMKRGTIPVHRLPELRAEMERKANPAKALRFLR